LKKSGDETLTMKPIVAIVGRPNVGKSTLFNRITRRKDALVDNYPGITRDRQYGDAKWDEKAFTLIDTGGFINDKTEKFAEAISYQVREAISDADIIIAVLDGKSGVLPSDEDIIQMLRGIEKPVFYVVNKIDGIEQEDRLSDFYSLGIENPYSVSGEHGYGIPDFLDDLTRTIPGMETEEKDDMIRLAVVGRPNVGKSSLINKILGEERLLVSEIPGTTRDAIDTVCAVNGKSFLLIDTAGIRRKGKVRKKIEKFSIIKALRSLERCDVALIVIDAEEGITDQDITIAGYAHDRGCGCVFVLNKWDAVEKNSGSVDKYYEELRMSSKFLSFAPAITISALTGLRVFKTFKLVEEVYTQYSTRMGTGEINRILERAVEINEPSLYKGKRLNFYYTTQTSSKPPAFICFVNYPNAVHFSYKRYLINKIREGTGLDKTPIKLIFRQRTGRIEFSSKKKDSGKRMKRKKS